MKNEGCLCLVERCAMYPDRNLHFGRVLCDNEDGGNRSSETRVYFYHTIWRHTAAEGEFS